MAALDLGKQVGPLPLGAWIAVVGTGVAVALYSRRTTAPVPTRAVGDDAYADTSSSDLNTGTGEVGGWVQTSPGVSVPAGSVPTVPTDNIEWGRRAVNLLINDGYDAAQAQSAITKALASGEAGQLSASEWTLWRVALMKLGAPPEPVLAVEPNSAPGPVDSGNAPDPVDDALQRAERFENYSGNAQSPNPDDLAVWQAEYDARNGIDNPVQALAYWKGTYRSAELRDYYASRFISTHGGSIY